MDTQVLIIAAAVIAVILIAIGVWYFIRQKRSEKLRERFGPEYHHTVRTLKNRDVAEAELRQREKRVSQFHIVPLPAAECIRYQDSWMAIQSEFVDHPETAVANANKLVQEVMERRGYPMARFEQSAADLSVDHPTVVENYRAAHRISERSRQGAADTEELRQALVYYRALFQDLLGNGGQISDKDDFDSSREHRRENNGRSIRID
jgi:hypothetical protein